MIEHEIKDYFLITRPQKDPGEQDEVEPSGKLNNEI